jgi:glycosyltransferase involved in cell wall biosynthesis
LLVIVPALNEEATVGAVVARAREVQECDVVLVDDGSSDGTAAVARAAGASVMSHPFNLGVGAALRTGFRLAVDRGYTACVQLDADGQHDAEEAAVLLDVLERESADMVVGSRFGSDYKTGALRRVPMRILSRVVRRQLGVTITDTTSGFRAFGERAIESFARGYPTAYLSDTVEALLLAGDWGLIVTEQSVRMYERQGGKPSAGRLSSSFHLARLALVLILHRVRRPLTLRGGPSDVEA